MRTTQRLVEKPTGLFCCSPAVEPGGTTCEAGPEAARSGDSNVMAT